MNKGAKESRFDIAALTAEMERREARPPKALQLNLLANGLDFISEGVEPLYGEYGARPAPRAYKYALLHISRARYWC